MQLKAAPTDLSDSTFPESLRSTNSGTPHAKVFAGEKLT